jgi:hypothetical protein
MNYTCILNENFKKEMMKKILNPALYLNNRLFSIEGKKE